MAEALLTGTALRYECGQSSAQQGTVLIERHPTQVGQDIHRLFAGAKTAKISLSFGAVLENWTQSNEGPQLSLMLTNPGARHAVQVALIRRASPATLNMKAQMASYNVEAAADEATPISANAQTSLLRWVQELERVVKTTDGIRLVATGTTSGGATIIIESTRTGKRFTLRYFEDGRFFMASGVSRNLRSKLFGENESTPEASIRWLNS